MVERWNIGHEKRNTDYFIRNVEFTFLNYAHRHLFSGFSAKIPHQNKKSNEIICVLNTGFFKPIIPRFQHSIIPIVSEAN